LISLALSQAFQADDEGSIPFTRSNHFNGLEADRSVIPTSGLLLIPTNPPFLFLAACRFRMPLTTCFMVRLAYLGKSLADLCSPAPHSDRFATPTSFGHPTLGRPFKRLGA
jgi:hypothetical protein